VKDIQALLSGSTTDSHDHMIPLPTIEKRSLADMKLTSPKYTTVLSRNKNSFIEKKALSQPEKNKYPVKSLNFVPIEINSIEEEEDDRQCIIM